MYYEEKETFNKILSRIISVQTDLSQPVYVIAKYWCGRFVGIEDTISTEGEKDLDEMKEIFKEKYAWSEERMGVTESSHKLIRIDISKILDLYGMEVKI